MKRVRGTRWQVHVALVALVAAVAALIAAGTASAATVRVAITGSVQTTAVVGGDPSIGISLAGVDGDLTYTGIGTSTGTIMQTYPSAPIDPSATGPGASLTVFHGDVSQGCVRVNGNRTLVVGLLPVNEQFDTSFGHIDGLGGLFEDNGVATAGPVDRAAAITYRTSSRVNACDPTKPFPTSSPGALNSGDTSFGYTDRLDGFPAKSDSDASVVNANGLSVSITDEPDPKGLRATVSAGSGFATLNSCGQQVNVSAGGSVRLTCASLIVEVVTGSAVVPLDDGTTVVSVPEGGAVEIAESTDGGSTIENIGQVPVEVTVDGVSGSISAGETVNFWDFQGFFGPVDNPTVMNHVKAGAAVALKWRILNGLNAPVMDLSTASITVTTLDCETGKTADQGGEKAAGGSGLQNLGGGYYQLNWKTPKSYAKSCKTVHLDIGDGVTHDAFFEFTK